MSVHSIHYFTECLEWKLVIVCRFQVVSLHFPVSLRSTVASEFAQIPQRLHFESTWSLIKLYSVLIFVTFSLFCLCWMWWLIAVTCVFDYGADWSVFVKLSPRSLSLSFSISPWNRKAFVAIKGPVSIYLPCSRQWWIQRMLERQLQARIHIWQSGLFPHLGLGQQNLDDCDVNLVHNQLRIKDLVSQSQSDIVGSICNSSPEMHIPGFHDRTGYWFVHTVRIHGSFFTIAYHWGSLFPWTSLSLLLFVT